MWRPCADVITDIPNFNDAHRRVLAVTTNGWRVISLYVPNGQTVGSENYQYKLRWLAALRDWLAEELNAHPNLVVLGDFNIAPGRSGRARPRGVGGLGAGQRG